MRGGGKTGEVGEDGECGESRFVWRGSLGERCVRCTCTEFGDGYDAVAAGVQC